MRHSVPLLVARSLRSHAGRSDAMVVAAALTCFAAFGMVPLLAIGVRVAAWCFGTPAAVATAQGLARFVPGPLGLNREVVVFAGHAARTPWWTTLVALVPVSLYTEGTVRCLQRFSVVPEQVSRTVRGRALTPVFVALAVLFVGVTVGALRPLLDHPFGSGLGPRLLGILIAFNVLFFGAFGTLLIVYRYFTSTPVRRGPLLFAAFAAASWIAGQTLGYVLAVRLVGGFAHAFGGYAPAAEVTALAFLIYLQYLILVFGYLLALVLHEERIPLSRRRSRGADVVRDRPRRHRDERQSPARVGRAADEEQPTGT